MKKHKVYLQELSAEFSEADYSKFYEVVMRRIENGELVPMKSAKNNGRKPAPPAAAFRIRKRADTFSWKFKLLTAFSERLQR